ncbi:M3R8, histidine kinase-group I protein sequence [Diplocarpon rosae]|nr:M3R8, histidine kinase-group I protein sequence [Diplocarpon rosae]
MLAREQSALDQERARLNPKIESPPEIIPPDTNIESCVNDGGIALSVPEDKDAPDESRLLMHDPTLTAFTQLAAYRLDCERSFISLMDYDYQYILAEATRSVSLLAQDQCDPGDEVYLGPRVLDRVWGVCPNTLQVFTAKDRSLDVTTPLVTANQECYIMNDMSAIDWLKKRPYVVGWPYMRFYAEVPIHSPTGHVIGTFCVVDNKPRHAFDRKGIDILKEIASSIMNHLDLVAMQRNLQQADRRLKSLGDFVEKKPFPEMWSPPPQSQSTLAHLSPHHQMGTVRTISDFSSRSRGITVAAVSDAPAPRPSSADHMVSDSLPPPRAEDAAPVEQYLSPFLLGQEDHGPDPFSVQRRLSMNDLAPKETAATGVRRMFSRACYRLREALELDGVMFIDASFYGPDIDAVKKPEICPDSSPPVSPTAVFNVTQITGRKGTGVHGPVPSPPDSLSAPPRPAGRRRRSSLAEVLGCVEESLSHAEAPPPATKTSSLPRSVLRGLLKKYQDGHIFLFDSEGELLPNHTAASPARESEPGPAGGSGDSDERKQWARELLKICPGALSIVFYPLWDTYRDQWFAGCLSWTKDYARVIQSSDVTYLAAFTSCIMSEKSRLDVMAADLQKLDFISSVSHELRTPLHGVLASTDALRQASSGPMQDDIIRTITVCGEVLLDTVDQILDFARTTKTTSASTTTEPSRPGRLSGPDAKAVTTLDLSDLVETVVEGVSIGHNFRKLTLGSLDAPHGAAGPRAPDSLQSKVMIILSIDWKASWLLRSQVGVWTRIVMNLVGNALKFTDSGFILVSLKSDPLPTKSTARQSITLEIEDSGRGISEEYIKYHLFTPFVQENHMSIGTGLGLSIVHQLVGNLDGKIHVQSELKHGTRMEVTVPLEVPSKLTSSAPVDLVNDVRARCHGLKLCLVDFDYFPDLDETPTGVLTPHARSMLALKRSLANMASDWFGMDVSTSSTLTSPGRRGISLALRSKLDRQSAPVEGSPLIVLEDVSESRLRASRGIHYMSMPVGPHKLARTLKLCLETLSATKPTFQSSIPEQSSEVILPQTQYQAKYPERVSRKATDRAREVPTTAREFGEVALPLRAPSSNTKGGGKPLPVTESRPANPTRTKVLIVEDNMVNLKVLSQYMKSAKQEYVTAMNGLEGLEKFQAEPAAFKLIFMDLSMPVMDGLTSTRYIRAFESQHGLPRTRIIALTCFSSTQYQRDAAESGVDMYIVKPVPMKSLKPILELDPADFRGDGHAKG